MLNILSFPVCLVLLFDNGLAGPKNMPELHYIQLEHLPTAVYFTQCLSVRISKRYMNIKKHYKDEVH